MKLLNLVVLVAVVITTVACGKVPSAYQGNFEDKTAGVSLALGDSDWTFTFSDKRVLKASVADVSFDALSAGKAGVYIKENPVNKELSDIYWLNPNLATKQAQGDFVWYQSEVIYTLLNVKASDKVSNIQFFHCMNGQVMLDLTQKTMQLGCPANPDSYNMLRSAN